MAVPPNRRPTIGNKFLAAGVLGLMFISFGGAGIVKSLFTDDRLSESQPGPGASTGGTYSANGGGSSQVARALAHLPEGALNPDFCRFEKVTTGRQGEKYDLWGTTALAVMAAGNRVHAHMRNTLWEPDGVIKQDDAAALFYVLGNVKLNYTFLSNPDAPNQCLVSWERRGDGAGFR